MNPLYRRAGFDCPSELVLDEWIAQELPAPRAEAVDRHVTGCGTCQQRKAERLRERALFADTASPLFPPAAAVAPARPRRRWPRAAVVAGALATLVLVPLVLRLGGDDTRVKGERALRFFVLSRDVVREGRPGERVQPGDRLRFGFASRVVAGRSVAILSRDASGKVSVYYPESAPGAQTAEIPAGGDGLLPYSIRLDDVLGPERLYLLLCDAPVALDPIRQGLAAAAAPDLAGLVPPSCQVEVHAIDKRGGW